MRRIGLDDLVAWCETSGYSLDHWRPGLPSATRRMKIALPSQVEALPDFVEAIIVQLESTDIERLVWVHEWKIWNDHTTEIGLRHLNLLVDGLKPAGSEQEKHIYVLQGSEWRDAIALLMVPLLYGWDAHLFLRSGLALVNLSHDGYVSLEVRGAPILLESWNTPQDGGVPAHGVDSTEGTRAE